MKYLNYALSYRAIKVGSDRIVIVPLEDKKPDIEYAYSLIILESEKMDEEKISEIINREHIIHVLQVKISKTKQLLESHTIKLLTYFKDKKRKREIEGEIALLEKELSERQSELQTIHKEAIIRTAITKTDLEKVKRIIEPPKEKNVRTDITEFDLRKVKNHVEPSKPIKLTPEALRQRKIRELHRKYSRILGTHLHGEGDGATYVSGSSIKQSFIDELMELGVSEASAKKHASELRATNALKPSYFWNPEDLRQPKFVRTKRNPEDSYW